MKAIILILTLVSFNLLAEENLINLPRPNLEVKMGELTGAGTRFSLKALAGFVHPNGYIMKEDCSNIVVKNSDNPKISDVVKIQVGETSIDARELTGFILQK